MNITVSIGLLSSVLNLGIRRSSEEPLRSCLPGGADQIPLLKPQHWDIKGRGRGLAPFGQGKNLGVYSGLNVLVGPCSNCGDRNRSSAFAANEKDSVVKEIQLSENITDEMKNSSDSKSQ